MSPTARSNINNNITQREKLRVQLCQVYIIPATAMSEPTDIRSIGCSLWLLPPSESPIQTTLSDLITTKIPSCFPGIHNVVFEPHLTLTSDIKMPPDIVANKQAQRWLDNMPLPDKVNIDVRFKALDVGAAFFKKLTLSVDKEPLERFGAYIRSTVVESGDMAAATRWVKEWAPHVSLMYADIEVTADKFQEILQVVMNAGIQTGNEHRFLEGRNCYVSKWNRIALIETWKEPMDWKIVASREI